MNEENYGYNINSEDSDADMINSAEELSEFYERQSRRYSKTLDAENEVR